MSLLAWSSELDDLSTLALFQTYEMHAKLDPLCKPPNVKFSEEITSKISRSLSSQTSNPQIQKLKSKWIQWKRSISDQVDQDEVDSFRQQYLRCLKSFFSSVSREFSDTDLIVVSDQCKLSLPPNVVNKSELLRISQIYKSIVNDETIFTIQGSGSFVERTYWDIRKILTRPTGRKLISDLLSHPNRQEICIIPGENSSKARFPYEKNWPVVIQLLDKQTAMIPVVNDQGKKYLQSRDSCSLLAHEMIHVLHHFKGERSLQNLGCRHLLYRNPEEARTITGNQALAGQIVHSVQLSYDPINENQLRRELGLPRRFGHRTCKFSGDWNDDLPRLNTFLGIKFYRDLDWMRGANFPRELDTHLINRFIQKKFTGIVVHFVNNYPDRFKFLVQDENTRSNILGYQELHGISDPAFQTRLKKLVSTQPKSQKTRNNLSC